MSSHSLLNVAIVTARFPPADSTGTLRVEALLEGLSSSLVRPTWITLPLEWLRLDGAIRQGQSSRETAGDVLRPTTWTDRPMRAWAKIPLLRRFQRSLFIPDNLAIWALLSSRGLVPQIASSRVVYATGPPYSALSLGRRLADHLDCPFVCELRDPPSLDRRARSRGVIGRRRLRRWERRLVSRATAVVTLTPSVKKWLVDQHRIRPDRVVVIPNGVPPIPTGKRSASDDSAAHRKSPFTIAYVGSVRSHGDAMILRQLCDALEELPDGGCLRLVGRFPDSILQPLAHRRVVNVVDRVSHSEALAEVMNADVSLVLADESESWWIGRKVFESLEAAKQILAIVPSGDTSSLLRRSDKALVVDRSDLDQGAVAEAVSLLAHRANSACIASTVKPHIPQQREMVEAVATTLRNVVEGRALPEDWRP